MNMMPMTSPAPRAMNAPGVSMHARYRLESDGTLTLLVTDTRSGGERRDDLDRVEW